MSRKRPPGFWLAAWSINLIFGEFVLFLRLMQETRWTDPWWLMLGSLLLQTIIIAMLAYLEGCGIILLDSVVAGLVRDMTYGLWMVFRSLLELAYSLLCSVVQAVRWVIRLGGPQKAALRRVDSGDRRMGYGHC